VSLDPAIFRALVEQGATPEMLLAVVEAAAAVDEARKEKKRANNAERQARHRNKNNARNALQGVTERDSENPPPNEYISNPPEPSGAKAPATPFAEKVVSVWNEGAASAGLSPARKLNTDRRKHLAARVREHGEEAVCEAIAALFASDWHCGRGGSTWKADLGWLLKSPENFQKMLERGASANGAHAKPIVADQSAYLAGLADKPWINATPRAEQPRRTGNTGPIRAIGDLIPLAGVG
jgi:hypothetical protein